MKFDTDGSQLLITSNVSITNIRQNTLKKNKKLSGIKLDSRLSFKEHINFFLQKSKPKTSPSYKDTNDLERRSCLMKTYIASKFNYCLLLQIFHGRALNNRISEIHEKVLKLVYQSNNLGYSVNCLTLVIW